MQLTLFDPIEIPLTQGYFALIDPIDADLAAFKWCVHLRKGVPTYAKRSSKTALMHRVILTRMLGRELIKGEMPDHINRNGFDNRRSNLRLTTYAQNQRNRKLPSSNTSGFLGVGFDKNRQKWVARTHFEGHARHIGYFNTPEDAYSAYQEFVVKRYGEFARFE